jgi:MFS family permease
VPASLALSTQNSVSVLTPQCPGAITDLGFKDGRRPIYLWSFLVMVIGSFGVASAQTVSQLMIWRVIQAMGAGPALSVGAGVIGDVYKLEERGAALGKYFGVCPFSSPRIN